jgi:hypothetical protein
MNRIKSIIFVLLFCIVISNVFGQESENNDSENWFLKKF